MVGGAAGCGWAWDCGWAWAWDGDGYRALLEQAGFEVRQHAGVGSYQVISAVVP